MVEDGTCPSREYLLKSKQEQTGQVNLDLLFKLSNSGLTLALLGIWYRYSAELISTSLDRLH